MQSAPFHVGAAQWPESQVGDDAAVHLGAGARHGRVNVGAREAIRDALAVLTRGAVGEEVTHPQPERSHYSLRRAAGEAAEHHAAVVPLANRKAWLAVVVGGAARRPALTATAHAFEPRQDVLHRVAHVLSPERAHDTDGVGCQKP